MSPANTEKFTVAFIFDTSLEKVLLVHKEKPEWQKGRINGVGGKYEEGETGVDCIRRETKEETNLDIADDAWMRIGVITQERGNVGVYAAQYHGPLTDAVKSHYEDVEWFEVAALPKNMIHNLHWFIPLALMKLTSADPVLNVIAEY